MGNPWMDHVQVTRKANAGKSFKEVLVLAGKTYKKGSSSSSTPCAKKARKSRKTKKSKKPRKTRKARKTRK